jgi:4-carboxymuconolactone decarboxylase
MPLPFPRIPALSDAQLTGEQREALALASNPGTPPLNIFRTLVHASDALGAFLARAMYILRNHSLPTREAVIVRIAFLCRCGYVWAHHVQLALIWRPRNWNLETRLT